MNLIIILALLFFWTAAADAQICEATGGAKCVHIATNGSTSNPGTFNSPFLNWSQAEAVIGAGDFVYYRAGTYTNLSSFIQYNKSINGAGGERITIKPYPGETVIFDNLDRDNSLAFIGGQGAIVEKFWFRNSFSNNNPNPVLDGWTPGVAIWAQHATFRFNQITGVKQLSTSGNTGNIRIQGGGDIKIHNNYLANVADGPGGSPTNAYHIISFSTGNQTIFRNYFEQNDDNGTGCYYNKHGNLNGSSILIYENYFKNCSAWGVSSGGQNVTVRHNIFIHDNTGSGAHAINNANSQGGSGGAASFVNHTFEYNTFYYNATIINFQFSVYNTSAWRRNIAMQTVSASGDTWFLRLGHFGSDADLTRDGPTWSMTDNCYFNTTGQAIRISWYGDTSNGAQGQIYSGLNAFRNGTGKEAGSLETNPNFVNAAGNDFHTQAGSQCANMGVYATGNPGSPVLSPQQALGATASATSVPTAPSGLVLK